MYGANGVESCIIITIVFMVEEFEQQRLFCLTPPTQYYGSLVGNDCFWHARDISMLEEEVIFLLEEGIQEEGFSNLQNNIVFNRNFVFFSSSQFEGFDVDEETMNGTPQDESNGYKCNIFNDSNDDGTMRRSFFIL